jgi:hypothetical protein
MTLELPVERRDNLLQRELGAGEGDLFSHIPGPAGPVLPRFQTPRVRPGLGVELFTVNQEICFELRCRLAHATIRPDWLPVHFGQ